MICRKDAHEAHGKGGSAKVKDGGLHRVGSGKINFIEDEAGHDTVQEKVIPFDDRADEGGDDHAAQVLLAVSVVGRDCRPRCSCAAKGQFQDLAGVFVHDLVAHFVGEGEGGIGVQSVTQLDEGVGAGKEHLVADGGAHGLHIGLDLGRTLVFGDVHVDVGVALAGVDGRIHEGVAAVAHDQGQLGEVTGDLVHVAGIGVFQDGAGHARRRSHGDEDGHIQFAALGVQGVEAGVAGGHVGQIGVDGDALHAVFLDDLFDLAHGGHLLVGVDAPEAHELVGIGTAEFEHAVVVGREAVGGLGVATGDHAQFHAHGVKVGHDLVQGLGLALVEADDFTGSLEHGAVLDAVDDLRRVGPESKVDNFHG